MLFDNAFVRNFCYSRSEYYTIPPLAELNQKIDGNGDVFVDDFVVGREGYGQVKFYGRTNVAGLNLDEIGECACDLWSFWHQWKVLLNCDEVCWVLLLG